MPQQDRTANQASKVTHSPDGLTPPDVGHLRYLYQIATQPRQTWEEFYQPRSEGGNFGTRFQLAFSTYALAALSYRTPAYWSPYATAMRALIERMFDPRVWDYWTRRALMLSPGQLNPDPLAEGNIQYSGHLSMMIGLYEKISSDFQYDAPFTLHSDRYAFPSSHELIAASIYRQMVQQPYHAVTCEPNFVYVSCNTHSAWSNLLHDQLHSSSFAQVNDLWVTWVQKRMLLTSHLNPLAGVLRVTYLAKQDFAPPVSFNFTDAWSLAFLAASHRSLVEDLYPRFRRRLRAARPDELYLPSARLNEGAEISDNALNTGFAYILARELGDTTTAEALYRYAEHHLGPEVRDGARSYRRCKSPLYTTSLFALGHALAPGGLQSLLQDTPRASATTPQLLSVEYDAAGSVSSRPFEITRADYLPERHSLIIGLAPSVALASSHLLHFTIGALPRIKQITCNDQPVTVYTQQNSLLTVQAPEGTAFQVWELMEAS